jgi:hypothetical protein
MSRYINIKEAAALLGQKYVRVYTSARFRDIPARQIAGKWFISPTDLDHIREFYATKDAKKKGLQP